ncbi:MAG: hypothetical protein ACYTGC_02295 [Planctomycetota bacterium]
MTVDLTVNPPQTVQLRHTLPDDTAHIDWMLDLSGAGPLTTFRLSRRLDELVPGEGLDAQRIADHRRVYLTYEGDVSDDRGRVDRLAWGRIEALQNVGETWGLLVQWKTLDGKTRPQRLCVRHVDGDQWRVTVLTTRH